MKYIPVLSLLFIFISCASKSHKPGIIKKDTVMAVYITVPYGFLQGGPIVRTIAYKEKITTNDSVNYTKSVVLDTTCLVFVKQPLLDSIKHTATFDSTGNQKFTAIPVIIPIRYTQALPIPCY